MGHNAHLSEQLSRLNSVLFLAFQWQQIKMSNLHKILMLGKRLLNK